MALLKLPSNDRPYMQTPSGNRIMFRGRQWCVLSADGSWVLSRHDSLEGARQWKKSRGLIGATIHSTPSARHLHVLGATGTMRTAVFEDREHVVVPVVALVEGVIFPVNAETPELVLAEEFAKTPQGWDGRPIMPDHPADDERRISANDPKTLDAMAFGKVFHTKVSGKRLMMEAWLDPVRAERIGAKSVIDRIRAGKMIEVSVGCFVVAEESEGVFGGRPYKAVWREIVPDHLALLPEGTIGACSNEMGCGTPRHATIHLVTPEGLEPMRGFRHAEGEQPMAEKGKEAPKKTWRDKIAGFTVARVRAPKGAAATPPLRAAGAPMSDTDLRNALDDALRAVCPGYLGIDSVFQTEGMVVYAAQPADELEMVRVSFTVDAASGAITLGSDYVEVEPITTFVPVDEQYEDVDADNPGGLAAAAAATPKTPKTLAAAGGCGCGKTVPSTGGEGVMSLNAKQERLKKVLPNVADADLTVLERTVSDEHLAVLEAAQPKPKEKTEEEFLADAPASIKKVIEENKARVAARKTELITTLKAAKQSVYEEAELAAMDLEALEKLVKFAGSIVPPKPALVDNSGRGLPKDKTDDEVPPPPALFDVTSPRAATTKRQ